MKYKFAISFLSFCLFLLVSTTISAQEKSTIKGKITLNDNESPEGISLALKGTRFGASTDHDGNYKIKNVKPGTYTLKVSAVGYTSTEKRLQLRKVTKLRRTLTLVQIQKN